MDALLFHEAGRRQVHRYRIYRNPFPHPSLRDGVVPRLLSCVAHSSENIDPVIGGAAGSGACGVFSGGSPPPPPPVRAPRHRPVSFADEVTMLGDAELPVCSPESPPLRTTAVCRWRSGSSWCPLPRVPVCRPHRGSPHSCGRSTMGEWMWTNCVLELVWTVRRHCRMSSHVSNATVSPEVGVLVSPLVDSSSGVAPAVGHARLPLPSVDNILVQDMLWAPAAPQYTRPNVDREIPVPSGGWLVRVCSLRSARRSTSVPWGPGVHSEIQLIARRTTQRQWGIMAFPCTTRGSSN